MSKNSITPDALPSKLAPFTGVDNATARLLKAISQFELNSLRDGDVVYVQSVRDYWKWVPTSTIADDSTGAAAKLRYCNPTVNGANPGRFERLFLYSPDWLIQNFTINNVTGNNEADGITTPLNNDNELYQRWGLNALFSSPVTVTYAQAPTTETNYSLRYISGGSVTILGTPIVTKAGTILTAIQTQVRTAGAELGWAITGVGLGAADVGKIAVITASAIPANINAYAGIVKDEGGGKLRIAPFGVYTPAPANFTAITPAVGDTIEIREPTVIKVGFISITAETTDSIVATPTRNCVIFDSVKLIGASANFNGGIENNGAFVDYVRCGADVLSLGGFTHSTGRHRFTGGIIASNGVTSRTGCSLFINKTGILGGILSATGSVIAVATDTYFQNAVLNAGRGGVINDQGAAFFDRTTSNQAILVSAGGHYAQTGATPSWGTANAGHGITVQSGSSYTYVTKPTVNGTLGAGRETQVGGTDKLYAAIPYIEGANNATLVLTA